MKELYLRVLQSDLQTRLNQKMELIGLAVETGKYANMLPFGRNAEKFYKDLDEACLYSSNWNYIFTSYRNALQAVITNKRHNEIENGLLAPPAPILNLPPEIAVVEIPTEKLDVSNDYSSHRETFKPERED
ncbi:hypothetical protein EPN87_00805 [archaeon]|nr:MAG: hypothetical protein EPN87_00805 [archaeon]